MKKYAFVSLLMLCVVALAVTVYAQRRHGWGGQEPYNYCPYCGTELQPEGGYGYGMGPGMMGRGGYGYGMGPGMMYRGMGPGMVGPGYGTMGRGMGPGMMGPGYGIGPGMMGRGGEYGYGIREECQKFLTETSTLRRQLHSKRFEYSEAIRNPKTTPETMGKLEKEIYDLQDELYKKAPPECR